MATNPSTWTCSWCGSTQTGIRAQFCPVCKAPNKRQAYVIYLADIIARSLAIPAIIALSAVYLGSLFASKQQETALDVANKQQETSLQISSRQKLADGLLEFGRTYADYNLATRRIKLLASMNEKEVSADDLRQAVLDLDKAMSSFGQKFIPFDEFARRSKFYGDLPTDKPTPLQTVWDNCYVKPYWVTLKDDQSYFAQISDILSVCTKATCPKSAAGNIDAITEKLFNGHCRDIKPTVSCNFVWIYRELRAITIEAETSVGHHPCDNRRI